MRRDLLKLHFLVFLWGLTGIFGRLIDLPAAELVLYRTGIAALGIAVLMRWRRLRFEMAHREALAVFGIGMLMGTHWMLFFGAINVSNVSVCMAGFATLTMWTALLEPLMIRERKVKRYELLLSAVAIVAMAVIFGFELDKWFGLVLALACAVVGAVFAILTGVYARRRAYLEISFYEMLGGVCVCTLVALVSKLLRPDRVTFPLPKGGAELFFLLLLALLCTTYAFSAFVELLRRLSVFTISLTNNLEPVYGIVLGALVFREYEEMSIGFYLGTALILVAVFLYPFLLRADLKSQFTQSSR